MKDNNKEDLLGKIFKIRRYITYMHRACYQISLSKKEESYHYLKFMSWLEYDLENLDENYSDEYGKLEDYIYYVISGLEKAKENFELEEYDMSFNMSLKGLENYLEELSKDGYNKWIGM